MPEEVSFSDFAEVAATRIDGEPPVIVGGQAVNVWAVFYLPRIEQELKVHAPFVSKDLDLYGSKNVLEGLARKYGVSIKWNPPRFPGAGQLAIPVGNKELKVELLSSIRGLRGDEAASAVDLTIQGVELRVLDPITCLKAKIANAADLDQTGRQDVKHVSIMKICVREFVKDILQRAEQNAESERAVVNCLEDIKSIIESPESRRAAQKWGLDLETSLPLDSIKASPLPKVQNFCLYRLK